VSWRFGGRYDRITRLHVYLEAREEATYVRGTDRRTDRSVFFHLDLVDTPKPFEIAIGSAAFTIPPDTMHSLNARHNKIIWELKLHGEIPNWPDVREEFVLQVLPRAGRDGVGDRRRGMNLAIFRATGEPRTRRAKRSAAPRDGSSTSRSSRSSCA
jgi:hypothetical protein